MRMQSFILWTGLLMLSPALRAANVELTLKFPASKTNQTSIYTVTAGKIDGEATVTAVGNETDGKSTVDAEIYGVKSTFTNRNAPYGGHITATIECHTQKFIKETTLPYNNEKTEIILAVASDRKIFGICMADEIKYASGTWAAYDKTKSRVLSIKLFMPVANSAQVNQAQQDIKKIVNEVIKQL